MPFDDQGRFIPEPDTARRPVLIGTIAWVIAAVVTAVLSTAHPDLRPWTLVCLVGVISGLGGLVYLRWRRARARG